MLQSIRNLGFGGSGIPDALPKALAELQGLTISLLTGAGSSVALSGIEAEDTIISAIAFGGSGSPNGVGMSDVTANVTITDRRATGTLTIATGLSNGNVVTVNSKVYTFTEMEETIAQAAGPYVVPIEVTPSGVDIAVVAARLAQVIMSGDASLTASASGGVVTITNRVAGTAGNSKNLLVASSGGHVTRSASTLLGGTATNSIKISSSTVDLAVLLVWFNKQ